MPLSETILVIMSLLCIAVVAESLCRRIVIPYTVFLVLIGIALSQFSSAVEALRPVAEFKLTPELVFFLFLPALVFESALNLDPRQLLKDIVPIISLAVPALLLTTFFVGFGMSTLLDMSLGIALLFGALIAATDPVAVVSLFKELGVPKRLMTLVEGESLFNDATAIVVFNIILTVVLVGSFSATELPHALLTFFNVFLGGALTGIIIGFACAELIYRLSSSATSALIMTLVSSYVSFVIAEHALHLSGVMAVLFAAIITGLHSISRLNEATKHLIIESWEVIASIANALLFLLIGISLDLALLTDNLLAITVAIFLVLTGRALSVFTMVPITVKLFHLPRISPAERSVMWWGGLKGGLAIAIVLAIPAELEEKDMLISLTLGVVLFTLLVNASTIRPVLSYLALDRMTPGDLMELKHGLKSINQHTKQILKLMTESRLLNPQSAEQITAELSNNLKQQTPQVPEGEKKRQLYAEVVRLEFEATEKLYQLKLIDEPVYIDLRFELRQKREHIADADYQDFSTEHPDGFIERLDRQLLRWLRELDSAAGILHSLQRKRMVKTVQKSIAHIYMGEHVLSHLKFHTHNNPVKQVIENSVKGQIESARSRLALMQRDFPEFYQQLELKLFKGAALESAKAEGSVLFKNREIGGKAYLSLDHLLSDHQQQLPNLQLTTDRVSTSYLVEQVPIFANLSQSLIERLASITQQIDFIPGDTVIGQGESGNALYIIAQGDVSVWREVGGQKQFLATLKAGDFFGESALLGDNIRNASIKAETPLQLIRMTQEQVLQLAEKQPSIATALEAARQQRKQA